MNRSPQDPNSEPTQRADLGYGGDYGEPDYYSEHREPTGHQPLWSDPPAPTPWYLRPVALVGLGVLTAILIALLVWGMVGLVHKEPATTAPTTTSAPSTTAPAEEPAAPAPAVPSTAAGENPPPATETEPPAATTPEPTPTTTSAPPTTSSTPETPTTTAPSTTPTTTIAPTEPSTPTTTRRPPEIVIPLPGF
ncbi:hypothetical protein [Mycolicibacter arupensis]|uniref:hypothetical protein n=1 Tax=Mycolicibacter arupensis TaxID=342002 RepID=UPI00061B2E0C|nr:hypothetical protein [Mycolicibacter arupensis]KAA1430946.1 hypothetical protein F0402_11250 [Mycolicibacter arupensis]